MHWFRHIINWNYETVKRPNLQCKWSPLLPRRQTITIHDILFANFEPNLRRKNAISTEYIDKIMTLMVFLWKWWWKLMKTDGKTYLCNILSQLGSRRCTRAVLGGAIMMILLWLCSSQLCWKLRGRMFLLLLC